MDMDQVTKNRFNQIHFSILLQLAKNPETAELLAPDIQEHLKKMQMAPDHLVATAALVVPDRPIGAIEKQSICTADLFAWTIGPNGANRHFKKLPNGRRKLVSSPKDSAAMANQKANAQRTIDFMIKVTMKEAKRARISRKYYQESKIRAKESIGAGREFDEFKVCVGEAKNLSATLDGFALADLFFLRNRNDVVRAGFDVKMQDKVMRELHKEVEKGFDLIKGEIPPTVRPAPSSGSAPDPSM